MLGTFAVLGLCGFSINMLTMFAMVLAIGLLVDDAIVVVENVERIMSEEGIPPREATRKSMDQITSALIGIGLVLSAVFGPDGVHGRLDRRHLPPVLRDDHRRHAFVGARGLDPDPGSLCIVAQSRCPRGINRRREACGSCGRFSAGSIACFSGSRDLYLKQVGHSLSHRYSLSVGVRPDRRRRSCYLFQRMPTAYLPDEDQGMMMVQAMLPPNCDHGA